MKVEDSQFPKHTEEPYYITLERFAEMIGLADRKELLEELIRRGEVPVCQFGKHRLIDLRSFLLLQQAEPDQSS